MHRRCKLAHNVLAVRGIGDGKRIVGRGEVAETVVVLARQHGIFHAALPGDGYPFFGVILFGIETAVSGIVFEIHDVFLAAVAVKGTGGIAFPTDFPFQQ